MVKIKATQHIRDTLDIIYDILGGVGVESFIVIFDGSGDDGQIESPCEFKPARSTKKAEALLGEVVKGSRVSDGTRYGPNGPEQMWRDDPTLERLIDGLCYDVLQTVAAGWEINDGSHGTFFFDAKKRKMTLDFNERVVQDKNFEFSL